ncbi:hypothetical protein J3A83DRAFT_4373402 [Scleroderma citrinum]
MAAWKKVDKNTEQVKSDLVNLGYCFSKPTLLVNLSTPEWKKLYLFNWLSSHMWRNFLNTINLEQLSLFKKSTSMKMAAQGGDEIIQSAQSLIGMPEEIVWQGMQIQVSSLLNPPLQLICSMFWELYELNFYYELYVLDQVLAAHLWATSDGALPTCQALLYSIFPGDLGLRMTLGPLPQKPCELGLCAAQATIALLYINHFCKLLSAWPGAPSHLQSPVELDG